MTSSKPTYTGNNHARLSDMITVKNFFASLTSRVLQGDLDKNYFSILYYVRCTCAIDISVLAMDTINVRHFFVNFYGVNNNIILYLYHYAFVA